MNARCSKAYRTAKKIAIVATAANLLLVSGLACGVYLPAKLTLIIGPFNVLMVGTYYFGTAISLALALIASVLNGLLYSLVFHLMLLGKSNAVFFAIAFIVVLALELPVVILF